MIMYQLLRNMVHLCEIVIHRTLFRQSINNLQQLRNSKRDETLLIVANGPSLNEVNLDRLQHFTSIGMNKIDMIFDKTTWRPEYVITGNPLVVAQSWKNFRGKEITYLLSIKSIFTGRFVRKAFYFLQSRKICVSTDFSEFVGSGGTVTFTALQFAYHLGAKRIILVGLDHNYSKETRKLNRRETEKFEGEDVNHFDPSYFKGQKWDLPNLEINEFSYKKFSNFAEAKGIEVLDCTIDGKLNVFKKGRIRDYYR